VYDFDPSFHADDRVDTDKRRIRNGAFTQGCFSSSFRAQAAVVSNTLFR
jgi:hypothetical protein